MSEDSFLPPPLQKKITVDCLSIIYLFFIYASRDFIVCSIEVMPLKIVHNLLPKFLRWGLNNNQGPNNNARQRLRSYFMFHFSNVPKNLRGKNDRIFLFAIHLKIETTWHYFDKSFVILSIHKKRTFLMFIIPFQWICFFFLLF